MNPRTVGLLPADLQERISVEANSGCWLWTGAQSSRGYGTTRYDGKIQSANRLVYKLLVGDIPTGLQLDHLCRTPCCCNPLHVEPVTAKVNINRGRRPNAEKTHCKHGHEFNEKNTIYKYGRRDCRACDAARHRARKQRL